MKHPEILRNDEKHEALIMRPVLKTSPASQLGVYAVEFSLTLLILLGIIFGVIELARTVFMLNTLQEVTRHVATAAVVTDFRDHATLDSIRQRAIFRTSPGTLAFGAPITDEHVYIDYLAQPRDELGALEMKPIPPSSLPSCPARNKQICMADPNDESCIRFVRVRICEPGSDCTAVPYQPIVPLIHLPFKLPVSTTILPAESLGFELGASPCG